MDLKRLKLAKECVGIINQLYDLAEVPTEKRQAINDKADKYLLDQVLRLCDVSQQRELLEAYTQFLWTQHNNLTDADNNKLALEKFIASYYG